MLNSVSACTGDTRKEQTALMLRSGQGGGRDKSTQGGDGVCQSPRLEQA